MVGVASIRDHFEADLWWHLASGRWMWDHLRILRADPFSFTVAGHGWHDHEWLFQVLIYPLYTAFQMHGVLLFKAGLLIISALGFYRALPKTWAPSAKAAVLLACFGFLRFRNMARADLISLTLFPWFISFYLDLHRQRKPFELHDIRDDKRFAVHIFLMWVWVNSHGGFLALWGATGLAALAWMAQPSGKGRSLLRNPFAALLMSFGLVSLVNPYGFRLLTSTLDWTYQLLTRNSGDFQEYLPTPYAGYEGFWIGMLLAWGICLAVQWQQRKWNALGVLWLTYATWVGHSFIRNIPFSFFLAIPVVCDALARVAPAQAAPGSFKRLYDGMILAGLLILLGWNVPRMSWGVRENVAPKRCAEFIRGHLDHRRGYNDYNLGGYLIWSLYDRDNPVFIDGRMHSVEGYPRLWDEAKSFLVLSPGMIDQWKAAVKRWDVSYAVVELSPVRYYFHDQAISVLAYRFPLSEWALVEQDSHAALYLRRAEFSPAFLQRYEIPSPAFDVDPGHVVTQRPWRELF